MFTDRKVIVTLRLAYQDAVDLAWGPKVAPSGWTDADVDWLAKRTT